jgi:hypothetical protein
MKHQIPTIAALAVLTIASPTSASTLLFADNFNTPQGGAAFNDGTSLTADQSGTAATKTYTTSGANFAYQRGNGGKWLMHASGAVGGSGTDMKGSLNYDIAAAANSQALGNQSLSISFNMNVAGSGGNDTTLWTSFTIGTQNPFVNSNTVGFSSLFRDNGATQQFSNTTLNQSNEANMIGETAINSFLDGELFTFLISDSTGTGSAFTNNGATDIVKMYFGATLITTFTNLNLGTDDQYISFHAYNTETYIDNLSITAVPEPSAALLGGLSVLALLRRRRA